jgi:ligand-binding SRPBCC domain-containing protein
VRNKELKTVTIINRPLSEVFDYFSKAENLNSLTPPELNFSILTPLPIEMYSGRLIDYKIELMGISFKWKTEITEWVPNQKFVDQQLKGPYKIWHHQHIFKDLGDKTEMTDIITYQSIGWIFAPFIHWLFVDQKVKEIFAYREKVLNEIFGQS